MQGRVKWFDLPRGYGFIIGNDGQEVFVHYSKILSNDYLKNLQEGELVSYDIKENKTKNKIEAINVRTII